MSALCISSESLPAVLDALLRGVDLEQAQAAELLGVIMAGQADPMMIAALLAALRAKGETAQEIAGFVESMTSAGLHVEVAGPLLDTCGTGGDGADTFNISTVSAVVCAAAGARVAKHGNRSASSACGSADLLEAWGVVIELGPEQVAACIQDVGIGFMFARTFHPAMKHVGPVRAAMGVRTVFNMLGPLSNPAAAAHQVVGVANASLAPVMAGALQRLGRQHALVFHGHNGLDELTTSGPSMVWEVTPEEVRTWELDPAAYGFEAADVSSLVGGDVARNVQIANAVLEGETGPRADVIALNAGAALWVGGISQDLAAGISLARDVLASGKGAKVRDAWVARSQQLAKG
ncbi:MAG: anthranilate phosphoribosyltransferase [Glaciecola sp.]|jgi:anthranilate phosphoribosyltransferase